MSAPEVSKTPASNTRLVELTPAECALLLRGVMQTRGVARLNMTDKLLSDEARQIYRQQFDTCGHLMVQLGGSVVELARNQKADNGG